MGMWGAWHCVIKNSRRSGRLRAEPGCHDTAGPRYPSLDINHVPDSFEFQHVAEQQRAVAIVKTLTAAATLHWSREFAIRQQPKLNQVCMPEALRLLIDLWAFVDPQAELTCWQPVKSALKNPVQAA